MRAIAGIGDLVIRKATQQKMIARNSQLSLELLQFYDVHTVPNDVAHYLHLLAS